MLRQRYYLLSLRHVPLDTILELVHLFRYPSTCNEVSVERDENVCRTAQSTVETRTES